MGMQTSKSEEINREIYRKIQNAQKVLVISHIRPDGDAVGSLLGMGLSLAASGKQIQMVLTDGVPKSLRHLPGSDLVLTVPDGKHDLTIALDCSDITRMGDVLNKVGIPDINIDHHATNLNFARTNFVKTEAVATAQILAQSIPEFGLSITEDVAACLMTGMITDTLGFRTSNMTPEALRIVADLMEINRNMPKLYQRALLIHSYEALRYWGAGLIKLQNQDKLVWTTLTREDRHTANYFGSDDADLINLLTTIEDAEIVTIFIEQNNHRVKVSWRSQPGVDVSKIALRFGGGGHQAASGAEIEGNLQDVQNAVLMATRSLFEGN
jgi:phosphoesterase RecJ-like protein